MKHVFTGVHLGSLLLFLELARVVLLQVGGNCILVLRINDMNLLIRVYFKDLVFISEIMRHCSVVFSTPNN